MAAADDVHPMSGPDDWLREAKECLESAQESKDSRIRDAWIDLAVEWMNLAAAAPETVAALPTHSAGRPN